MPIVGKPGEKGDLVVKFKIMFPKVLKNEHKQGIIDILQEHAEERAAQEA